MNKLLVIEIDGITDIVNESQSLGWEPVFIQTGNYKSWLPVDSSMKGYTIYEYQEFSFFDIIKFYKKNRIQAILPISLLEPECVRDALAKDYISQFNLPVRIVANTPSAVELTYDKWLTKEALSYAGLPVIPGMLIESNNHLSDIAGHFGFPVIVKQRKNYTGQGLRIIQDKETLQNFIKKYNAKDYIAEPFTKGMEISLEVISWKGRGIYQPLVYKGETRTNIYEHPAYRPRVSPWKKNTEIEKKIISIAEKSINVLNLSGAVEFEFIIDSNEQPFLLEINPRVSGVTRLCAAAGGVNVYKLLTRVAITDEIDNNFMDKTAAYAMQLPLTILPEGNLYQEFKKNEHIKYIKPITWMPLLPIKSNIIISYDTLDGLLNGITNFEKYTNEKYINEAKNSIHKSF